MWQVFFKSLSYYLSTLKLTLRYVHVFFTGNTSRLSLQVSGDGMRVLLVAITGKMFLWECMDVRDLSGLRDGTVNGRWAHICPLEDSILPSLQDKEASQHTIFSKTEVSNWIKYIYIIWHIASVFSHWKTCTPFLVFYWPSSFLCDFFQVMGDVCLSAFVFTSGKKLVITCLKIQWEEGPMRVEWVTVCVTVRILNWQYKC